MRESAARSADKSRHSESVFTQDPDAGTPVPPDFAGCAPNLSGGPLLTCHLVVICQACTQRLVSRPPNLVRHEVALRFEERAQADYSPSVYHLACKKHTHIAVT